MKFQFLLLVLVTTSIPLVLLSGCSGQNDVVLNNQEEPATPESFSDAKSTWTKTKGMTEHDTRRLTKYFTQNPSIAEHSIINGDPVIYSSDNQGHRYYWVQNGIGGTEWMCLEVSGRGAKITDGKGDLFVDD